VVLVDITATRASLVSSCANFTTLYASGVLEYSTAIAAAGGVLLLALLHKLTTLLYTNINNFTLMQDNLLMQDSSWIVASHLDPSVKVPPTTVCMSPVLLVPDCLLSLACVCCPLLLPLATVAALL
jgi:hypothetical protein